MYHAADHPDRIQDSFVRSISVDLFKPNSFISMIKNKTSFLKDMLCVSLTILKQTHALRIDIIQNIALHYIFIPQRYGKHAVQIVVTQNIYDCSVHLLFGRNSYHLAICYSHYKSKTWILNKHVLKDMFFAIQLNETNMLKPFPQ